MMIKVGDKIQTDKGFTRVVTLIEEQGKEQTPKSGDIILTENDDVVCFLSAYNQVRLGKLKREEDKNDT